MSGCCFGKGLCKSCRQPWHGDNKNPSEIHSIVGQTAFAIWDKQERLQCTWPEPDKDKAEAAKGPESPVGLLTFPAQLWPGASDAAPAHCACKFGYNHP